MQGRQFEVRIPEVLRCMCMGGCACLTNLPSRDNAKKQPPGSMVDSCHPRYPTRLSHPTLNVAAQGWNVVAMVRGWEVAETVQGWAFAERALATSSASAAWVAPLTSTSSAASQRKACSFRSFADQCDPLS